jgi:uncharacterized protein YbcI
MIKSSSNSTKSESTDGAPKAKNANSLRTQGEIEAEVCSVIRAYAIEFFGRGPSDVRAHLIHDLLLVRLEGALTVAEKKLVTLDNAGGSLLIKKVRCQMVELAQVKLKIAIEDCTTVGVCSLHHDISADTGDEIFVFTLSHPPITRALKRK